MLKCLIEFVQEERRHQGAERAAQRDTPLYVQKVAAVTDAPPHVLAQQVHYSPVRDIRIQPVEKKVMVDAGVVGFDVRPLPPLPAHCCHSTILGNASARPVIAVIRAQRSILSAQTSVSGQRVDLLLKWSCFSGQFCGSSKMHLVCVHAAFRVSALPKYAMSGVRLSRAV
jgi:hypothetical protein